MYSGMRNITKVRETYLRLTKLATQDPKPFYGLASTDWLLVRDKTNPPSEAEANRLLAEGMANVDIALALNPSMQEAMAYKNLLLRDQAARTSDTAKRDSLLREADTWFQKALDTMKQQQTPGVVGGVAGGLFPPSAPPPPPPPPPPGALMVPQRIGGDVAQANLIHQVKPIYPPEARAARIQGVVLLQATIDKQGNVSNLNVISGHSQLNGAALDAVKQWRYKPQMLNGQPIDVVTTITVNFVLQ
jgi:TonB family protein